MPSTRYRLTLGARMVAFTALTVRLSARQEALMFIVLAYHAADGTTRYLPDLRRCQLPLTAESIRAAATPSLQEAQLFSVELDCLAGCIALALKPSLPQGTEQHDWGEYLGYVDGDDEDSRTYGPFASRTAALADTASAVDGR